MTALEEGRQAVLLLYGWTVLIYKWRGILNAGVEPTQVGRGGERWGRGEMCDGEEGICAERWVGEGEVAGL